MYAKLHTILVPFPPSDFVYCENMSSVPELVDLRGEKMKMY